MIWHQAQVAVFVALAGFIVPAYAAEPEPPPSESGDPASASMRAAVQSVRDGDAAGLLQLRALYRATPSTPVLLNLAVAELNLGSPAQALALGREYLQRSDAVPEKIARVKSEFLQRAYARSGHLRLPRLGRVEYEVDDVRIDAAARETSDADHVIVDMDAGKHELKAYADGAPRTWRIDVSAGSITEPPAELEIGLRRKAPLSTAPPIDTPTPRATTPARPDYSRFILPGGLALAGASALGLAVWQGSNASAHEREWLEARERARAANKDCPAPGSPACTEIEDSAAAWKRSIAWKDAMLIAGGVLLGASATTMLLNFRITGGASSNIALQVQPGGAMVHGTF
jgi:hypothetical protein